MHFITDADNLDNPQIPKIARKEFKSSISSIVSTASINSSTIVNSFSIVSLANFFASSSHGLSSSSGEVASPASNSAWAFCFAAVFKPSIQAPGAAMSP